MMRQTRLFFFRAKNRGVRDERRGVEASRRRSVEASTTSVAPTRRSTTRARLETRTLPRSET